MLPNLCSSKILYAHLKTRISTMASFGHAMEFNTPRVLSINSHCVHGYVGNKAAVFPLQCMGFDVSAINTTTLSNRPGYPSGFQGKAIEQKELLQLMQGLKDNSLLSFDLVITGYISSSDVVNVLGVALDTVRAASPGALVVCDPVLGDNGRYYVASELLDFYKKDIIPRCNVVAPNAFETAELTGVDVRSVDAAREACRRFHSMGPDYCLLKGVRLHGNTGPLSMVLSSKVDKRIYCIDFDNIEGVYFGCGDLCTALASGWLYKHRSDLPLVLEKVSSIMQAVISLASTRTSYELPIIESRMVFYEPPQTSVSSYPAHGRLSGVIFDMDGTLTAPGAIDFDAMYDRIGMKAKKGMDILTQISEELPTHMHEDAHAIIVDEELKGCDVMELMPDLGDLLTYLRENNVRAAISTRNCNEAFVRFRAMAGFADDIFAPVLSRESLNGVNKPDPKVAHHILAAWEVGDRPHEIWFVGDSLDDMKCGKGAGCRTCLIAPNGTSIFSPEQAKYIDISVPSLTEFMNHLRYHDICTSTNKSFL